MNNTSIQFNISTRRAQVNPAKSPQTQFLLKIKTPDPDHTIEGQEFC